MDISKALNMYEITDISEETNSTLNKKYKKLSKVYHPDAYKDDGTAFKEVKSAYDTLIDLLKQLNILRVLSQAAPEEKLIYITLGELIQIYTEGKCKDKDITKSDLHKNRVYIIISVDTLYKGEINSFTTIGMWNVEDRYQIDIDLEDTNILEESEVDIKILKYTKHIELKYQSTKFVATLDNGIKIALNIIKKLKVER